MQRIHIPSNKIGSPMGVWSQSAPAAPADSGSMFLALDLAKPIENCEAIERSHRCVPNAGFRLLKVPPPEAPAHSGP